MPRLHFPAAALMPLPPTKAMSMIKNAGFDGVEILLGPGVKHEYLRAAAQQRGLHITWHQIWSLEESPTFLFNHIAALIGMIGRRREPLRNQLPTVVREPVVCYADRLEEAGAGPADRLWLQTLDVRARDMWSFPRFVETVRRRGLGVVFDTQHVLEYKLCAGGVRDLYAFSADALQSHLLDAWGMLGASTREIHFNNFLPKRGNVGGRNCLPDDGILDLRTFARVVKNSGWDGIVTPEVSPAAISGIRVPCTPFGVPSATRLAALRARVAEMFS